MRLYLSSDGFGGHLDRLKQMVGANTKVLFVDNAKDFLTQDERAKHVDEKRQEFERAGFEFYELDLRNYFENPGQLPQIVHEAGLVWLAGGNTFVLRRAMAYSGLDDILGNKLRADSLVCGGSSAGSIVMTKTLRGTENGDDPYLVPEGYKEDIIWNGLGLVYPQLVPHYESEWFGSESQAMVDYFEHSGLKYVTMRDGDVYVVDGEYEELLG